MVPVDYHGFFGGCASVAGTLIGLLFVAVSVSPHKQLGTDVPLAFRIQGAVAMTTLVNALVVAVAALLPGENLGTATVILSAAGLSSTVGLIVLSFRDRPDRRQLWSLVIIPVLGVLYALQLRSGIALLRHPADPGPVHFEAVLVIVFFLLAIARAWRMIGAQGSGMLAVAGGMLRERQRDEQGPS